MRGGGEAPRAPQGTNRPAAELIAHAHPGVLRTNGGRGGDGRAPFGLVRGKVVVLEWTNADCPFTRKHYESGNMQSLQALARDHGVVWLSIISSAPGKQGYVDGRGADELSRTRHAVPTAVLLDPSGSVGRLYHAKTTPHLFVIDARGDLRYMGGIDSIATTDVSDIAKAEPYLKEAMLAVVDGRPVAHPVTRPYGCSVKY